VRLALSPDDGHYVVKKTDRSRTFSGPRIANRRGRFIWCKPAVSQIASCHFFPFTLGSNGNPAVDPAAMAKKSDKGPAPICTECGGRMSHYSTLPKTADRPAVNVYRCDHCGETAIKQKV
jgi:DNA-directed RNA polymerase subunit M/transcription elongation factor TFIIS